MKGLSKEDFRRRVDEAIQLNNYAWSIFRRNADGIYVMDDGNTLDMDIDFLEKYISARPLFLELKMDIHPNSIKVLDRLKRTRATRIKKKIYEKTLKNGERGERNLYHRVRYLPKSSYNLIYDTVKHLYVSYGDLVNELDCLVLSKNHRRLFILESKYWEKGDLHIQPYGKCKVVYVNHQNKIPSPFAQVDLHRRLLEMVLQDYDIIVTPIIVLTNQHSAFVNETGHDSKYPVVRCEDLLQFIESYDSKLPMSDDEVEKILFKLHSHIRFDSRKPVSHRT